MPDRKIYFGPAFVCEITTKKVPVSEVGTYCPDPRCPDYWHDRHPPNGERRKKLRQGTKFCPSCGHKSVTEEVECELETVRHPTNEYLEEVFEEHGLGEDDLLVIEQSHGDESEVYYFPDSDDGYGRELEIDSEYGGFIDGASIDRGEETQGFVDQHADHHVALKEAYGETHVAVKWGLFYMVW